MKIWQLAYHDDDGGSGEDVFWAASKREIDAEVRRLKADPPANFFVQHIKQCDVPTTKKALVRFLNIYAGTG